MSVIIHKFGSYTFSVDKGLFVNGNSRHMPRRFRLLLRELLEANGKVVDFVTLHNSFSRTHVLPEAGAPKLINLNQNIHWLRKHLNDHDGTIIQTVLKKGYRIGIPIERIGDSNSSVAASKNDNSTEPKDIILPVTSGENDARKDVGFDPVAKFAHTRTSSDTRPDDFAIEAIAGRIRPADYAASIADNLTNAIVKASPEPSALAALGWLKGAVLGSLDEGLSRVDAALQASPNLSSARFYRAWLLIASRRLDAALLELERGLFADQRHDRLLFMKAWVLCALGRYGEVDVMISRSLTIHPNHLMLRVMRSINLASLGEFKNARYFLEQSASIFPHSTFLAATISWVDAKQGNRRDALQTLARPQRTGSRYILPTAVAAVYTALGDRYSTSAYLRIAEIDQDPWRQLLWCDPRCNQTSDPRQLEPSDPISASGN